MKGGVAYKALVDNGVIEECYGFSGDSRYTRTQNIIPDLIKKISAIEEFLSIDGQACKAGFHYQKREKTNGKK